MDSQARSEALARIDDMAKKFIDSRRTKVPATGQKSTAGQQTAAGQQTTTGQKSVPVQRPKRKRKSTPRRVGMQNESTRQKQGDKSEFARQHLASSYRYEEVMLAYQNKALQEQEKIINMKIDKMLGEAEALAAERANEESLRNMPRYWLHNPIVKKQLDWETFEFPLWQEEFAKKRSEEWKRYMQVQRLQSQYQQLEEERQKIVVAKKETKEEKAYKAHMEKFGLDVHGNYQSKSTYQIEWEKSGNSLWTLFAMARGLKNFDGSPIWHTDEVFRKMDPRTLVPGKNHLVAEIKRRIKRGAPNTAANKMDEHVCLRWLDLNPVNNPEDVHFILDTFQWLTSAAEAYNNAPSGASQGYLLRILEGTGLTPKKKN